MDAIMKTKHPRQQAEMTERIRAAVEENPRKMTLQLARDLGVPEVEVIRAFPSDRVIELDISRWQELLHSLEALGPVRVLVSNGATTITLEVRSRLSGKHSSSSCAPNSHDSDRLYLWKIKRRSF
jgi:putative heme iron utilization protein